MPAEHNPNAEIQDPKALARIAELEGALAEVQTNAEAIVRVIEATREADTANGAAKAALDSVMREFGWSYGSFWTIDRSDRTNPVLRFAVDSGRTSEEFRQTTMTSTFPEGIGLNGRTWRARELIFVKDIGDLADCVRAPVAKRMGIRSGVCFPVLIDGDLIGTMDFFVNKTLDLSRARMDALRNVSRLLSLALTRIDALDRDRRNAANFQATIARLADNLTHVSSTISSMTTAQSKIAQDQATSIAQLSTAMVELRQMAIQAMDGAQSVIDVSERARVGAVQGQAAVESAVRGMLEIRTSVQELGARVGSLSTQTKQIGDILLSVGEIAEQSRLLALNAAMEAARAGVHGRGFSVVAAEIRTLASQSKDATAQVRKILGEIKQGADALVQSMTAGAELVEAGVAVAAQAGERIQTLAQFVGEATEAARYIAAASRQQGAGVSQAAEAIGVINNGASEVVHLVRQANATVDRLEATVLDITSALGDSDTTANAGEKAGRV